MLLANIQSQKKLEHKANLEQEKQEKAKKEALKKQLKKRNQARNVNDIDIQLMGSVEDEDELDEEHVDIDNVSKRKMPERRLTPTDHSPNTQNTVISPNTGMGGKLKVSAMNELQKYKEI